PPRGVAAGAGGRAALARLGRRPGRGGVPVVADADRARGQGRAAAGLPPLFRDPQGGRGRPRLSRVPAEPRDEFMTSPLVSILMPVYNAELWLAAAVRSALAQTWPRTEIIVVDDGSTDRSLALLGEFESPAVKVLSQPNAGAAAARNAALREAQGEFIQY